MFENYRNSYQKGAEVRGVVTANVFELCENVNETGVVLDPNETAIETTIETASVGIGQSVSVSGVVVTLNAIGKSDVKAEGNAEAEMIATDGNAEA